MNKFWETKLTPEQEAELIDNIVERIHRHHLETPAILFFEMHKPLAGLAGQAMVVASPMAIPFFGFDAVNDYSRLLGDRSAVENLIQRLEESRLRGDTPPEDTHAVA